MEFFPLKPEFLDLIGENKETRCSEIFDKFSELSVAIYTLYSDFNCPYKSLFSRAGVKKYAF